MPTNYNPDTDALETMQERFAREAEVDERIMRGEREKAAKTEHTPEPVFLLDGARFKLSFNEVCCEECGTESDRVTVEPLGMYANDLQGRWVALVPAEDDKHLDLLHIKKQRDELLADVERCYRMLLSEPDTQGALFKAENILREAIASVKEK